MNVRHNTSRSVWGRLSGAVGGFVGFNVDNVLFAFRSSSDAPLVSVVVPAFNEEPFIRDCLRSVRSQSYGHFECIVVDDGSGDGTRAIAEEFVRKDERFRLIGGHVNRGISATRNMGLARARGKYVTFLDADDFLLKHSLWRRVHVMEHLSGPDDAGSFCCVVSAPESGRSLKLRAAPFRVAPQPWIDFISAAGECPFPVNAPLLRTDVIRKFGGFNTSMRHAEDWDLWYRILRHGYRFIPSHSYGAAYRQKRGSMIRTSSAEHIIESLRLIEKSYHEMPRDEAVDGCPYLFQQSLGFYQRVITETRWLIGYTMTASLAGNDETLARILSRLTPGSVYYITRHVNISRQLDEATERLHGFDSSPCDGSEIHARKQEVRRLILAWISRLPSSRVRTSLDMLKADTMMDVLSVGTGPAGGK